MNVRTRILAARLMEKLRKQPDYGARLGLRIGPDPAAKDSGSPGTDSSPEPKPDAAAEDAS